MFKNGKKKTLPEEDKIKYIKNSILNSLKEKQNFECCKVIDPFNSN